jgi:hypothetical protein
LGRFLSGDPFPGLLTIPQSLHPYSYVFNNPATLSDPSGHFAPILIALIVGGVAGGGFAAWGYMQAHPCADFWSDPAFQRAVGLGILAGMAGGAAGLGAGIALGFFIPSSTLAGAIVLGAATGVVGGGAAQATANALTGQSLTTGLTEAVLVGAVAGGALGHGVGRVWKALRPNIAYRNPAVGEHPEALLIGFRPKNPEATYSAAFHVSRGSSYETQFISLTRSLEVARASQKPGIPIYKIDLNKVYGTILDLTDEATRNCLLKHPIANNLAKASQEVLIERGWIPPEAIIKIISQ